MSVEPKPIVRQVVNGIEQGKYVLEIYKLKYMHKDEANMRFNSACLGGRIA